MSNNIHKLYEYMDPARSGLQIIHEDKNGKRELWMKGIFVQGDVRNQNQRVYPVREIARAVSDLNEKFKKGESILGELDHPEELSINLDRVSHVITEMWMDGANGNGKLKLLNTPTGIIAQTLLESGVKLGVSSRGSGNVGHNGEVSEFNIVTVDIVAQPSAPEAYPKTIYESLYNMRGGAQIHRLAENATQDPSAEKYLQKDIVKFINELRKK